MFIPEAKRMPPLALAQETPGHSPTSLLDH